MASEPSMETTKATSCPVDENDSGRHLPSLWMSIDFGGSLFPSCPGFSESGGEDEDGNAMFV